MRYAIEETEAYKILARRAAEANARYAADRAARPETARRSAPPAPPAPAGLVAVFRRAIGGGSAGRSPAQ